MKQSASSEKLNRLKLATFKGHCQLDPIAARRSALIELLAGGGPHLQEKIIETLQKNLGPCWGKRPGEALQRDLNALRLGGIRIGYSRRKGAKGYYLKHPALDSDLPKWKEPINQHYVESLRSMPVEQKLQRAFSMAEFALNQRRLILKRENPNWSEEKIEAETRKIVYGTVASRAQKTLGVSKANAKFI